MNLFLIATMFSTALLFLNPSTSAASFTVEKAVPIFQQSLAVDGKACIFSQSPDGMGYFCNIKLNQLPTGQVIDIQPSFALGSSLGADSVQFGLRMVDKNTLQIRCHFFEGQNAEITKREFEQAVLDKTGIKVIFQGPRI